MPEYSEFYLVGEKINSWSTTENRVALEAKEGGIYEATLNLEAGQDGDFKVIAFDEAGAMAWFGGADENNVGFFLLNNDMLGNNISLAYGSAGANFRPEVAGNYTIQVFEKPATTGLKAASEPLVMKVVKNSDTAIETISTSAVDNTWYNLQGVKFNGKPSVPGIYDASHTRGASFFYSSKFFFQRQLRTNDLCISEDSLKTINISVN